MPDAAKIIKDWCASCGMPEPSDGECHALAVAISAAAPVVLPEPFALYDGEKWYANEEAAICSCANMQKLQKVYTEQQVRALLAIGGQAQAEHIKALIEVSRMPNQEHVADAHNDAVRHLRAIAATKGE